MRASLMLIVSSCLLVACQKNEPATTPAAGTPAASAAPEARPPATTPAATPADAATGNPLDDPKNVARMGAVMLAMTEVCGLTKQGEGLSEFKAKIVAEGGSPEEVDTIYQQALSEARAKATSDPAKAKRSCDAMRSMAGAMPRS